MDNDDLKERITNVMKVYSAFDALTEGGINDVFDETVDTQMKCPWHGADNRPSSRYYYGGSKVRSHFYCFKCHMRLNSVSIFSKFNNIRFMDALKKLESRFGIKVKDRNEISVIFKDKDHKYVSDKWSDIESLIVLAENKLLRIKDKCHLHDYVKFCRIIDNISYDFIKTQSGNQDMSKAMFKLFNMMNEIVELDSALKMIESY